MAAADYAEGKSQSPPPELSRAWRCQGWQTLPRAGGLDDQPLALMLLMETAMYTYDAFITRSRTNPAGWLASYPRLATFCTYVDTWRADRG